MASVDTTAAQSTNGHGGGAEIAVSNPATGEVIAHVADLSAERVAELAAIGRAAQPGWQAIGFDGRGRVMRRMQKWVMDNADRVVATIVSETGKTYEDAYMAEINYAGGAIAYWAKHAEDSSPTRRPRHDARGHGQEARRPLRAARPRRRHRPRGTTR